MNSANQNTELTPTIERVHKLRLEDPKKALEEANLIYNHSLKTNDEKLEAESLFEMGLCFETASSYANAMKCLLESIRISNAIGNTRLMADALNYVGIIHDKLGNYANALKAYFKALRYYEFLEDKQKESIVLSNIGLIYASINDYKSALKFYSQALEIAEDENDLESLIITNINIGLAHMQLGNITDAERFLKDAIRIADSNGDIQKKSLALDTLGEIESSRKNYAGAHEILNSSLELKKQLNDKKGISQINLFRGKLKINEGKLEEAAALFLESLKLAEELGLTKSVFEIHGYLSGIYEKQGNLEKSIEHLKNSFNLESEYLREQAELRTKNVETQGEIEQAQKEAEIERLKNVELANALREVKQLNISLKELNDEKNEFMAIAVHDLKNPLLNILSTARIIKKREYLSKEQSEEYTDIIVNQTDRMFGLIKKLLDHNAIEQGKIKVSNSEFQADTLCKELVENFSEQAAQKEIGLNYENQSAKVSIVSDRVLLYEILQNLLSNAIKFSPHKKNVVLKTYTDDTNVYIEIRDEGPGFTEDDKKKMFTKFARLSAKPTGDEHSTGLGLSIAKKLTEFINGNMRYESIEGKGTRFILSLPLSKII